MKFRYFIQLSYKGTNYHGWQSQARQAGTITVQSVLNNAFSTLLKEEIEIVGAGRTDTGVHAKFFVAHFDSAHPDLDNDQFVLRVNKFLPNDISIQKINRVIDSAHSRFSALSRTYEYHISRKKNPFIQEYSCFLPVSLDVDKMNEAARILFDYSDFSSFSKGKTDTKTNNCKIYQAEWREKDDLSADLVCRQAGRQDMLIFIIKADRFLRNMVRAIVGTLLDVGKGKMTVSEFRKVIESKNRTSAGFSVPAKGLFLTNIEYPDEIYKCQNTNVLEII